MLYSQAGGCQAGQHAETSASSAVGFTAQPAVVQAPDSPFGVARREQAPGRRTEAPPEAAHSVRGITAHHAPALDTPTHRSWTESDGALMTTIPRAGKRHAFYIDETMWTEHGYIPSIVTEDEPGHTPMRGNGPHASPWYWGHDLATARTIAAEANTALGLSDRDVRDIITSSFRASATIAEAGQVIRCMMVGAASYDVTRADTPEAGWILRRVTLTDGTVADHDDEFFPVLVSAVAPHLSRIAWGAWGDRDGDSVLRIDVRTGRWLREP